MNKNYINIILLIWFGLLWANPTMASFENSKTADIVVPVISKDTLNPKEKDTVKTKKVDKAPASASVTLVPTRVRRT